MAKAKPDPKEGTDKEGRASRYSWFPLVEKE
jgi:hypothetical protein